MNDQLLLLNSLDASYLPLVVLLILEKASLTSKTSSLSPTSKFFQSLAGTSAAYGCNGLLLPLSSACLEAMTHRTSSRP